MTILDLVPVIFQIIASQHHSITRTIVNNMELIDSSDNSLTVSWPEVTGAERYVLQYRKDTSSDQVVFETLSEKLTTTQARKRNLDQAGYIFRAGAIKENGDEPKTWVTHQEAFQVLTEGQETTRMVQPKVQPAGNQAVKVSWDAVEDVAAYELQMRENEGGTAWKSIAASLSGTEVRKKNLTSKKGYMFRIRPAGPDLAFSVASEIAVGASLSDGIKSVFAMLDDGELLIDPKTVVPVAEALAGKEFVLLYASAHWCPPCRKFTPMLETFYQQVKNSVEVVFLSADHDEAGFASYFKSMPWKAVPYDDDGRDKLMAYIKVTGIPRLVVLDGKTGRTLVDNAVGQPLDLKKWRQLAAK
jgi:nucleoredoxin